MICYPFNIMITNIIKTIKQKMRKSPLLAKVKFEPIFFQVLWRFASSLLLPAYAPLRSGRQDEAGGRGVWSLPFRPPSPDAISVRIFSNRHRSFSLRLKLRRGASKLLCLRERFERRSIKFSTENFYESVARPKFFDEKILS